MKTILYRIPDQYFPSVRVTKPFYAKVNYNLTGGKVEISDAAFSANCLRHITDTGKLVEQMQDDIEAAEIKKSESNIHPIMEQALFPAIMHLQY